MGHQKQQKTSTIAKHMLSAKTVLYDIFFSGKGVANTGEKGKSVTGKYFKDVVLKKYKKTTYTVRNST